jgi:hypothetical protein
MPEHCAGYTTRLPEVCEATHARLHWGKGELSCWTDGEPVTEPVRVAIEILETEYGCVERWAMTSESEGGGRRDGNR